MKFLTSLRLKLLLIPAILLLTPATGFAQPGRDKETLSFDRNVGGLLQRYCFNCHGKEDPSAEIDLQSDENVGLIAGNPRLWKRVLEQVQAKTMPPEGDSQPSDEQRQHIIDFLVHTFENHGCDSSKEPGPPQVRRLNRREYNRTIESLLGVDFGPADDFPPDSISYGFDNIAGSLTLDPVQVQRYHDAATSVLDQLIENKSKHAGAYNALFTFQPAGGKSVDQPERSQVRTILESFVGKAFRRPPPSDFVNRLINLYEQCRRQKLDHVTAMRHTLSGVLISPRFLMRIEAQRPDVKDAYPVDAYDLATRLSYFLWSGPPDAKLTEVARSGKLSEPVHLKKQVRRMCLDEKAAGLREGFFEQWLNLNTLASHQVDEETFPHFNDELRRSMVAETRGLIDELIRDDRPITDLIDADYTYVDARLANHYGWTEIAKDLAATPMETRRVSIPSDQRGGLLTTAGMLTLTADPGRTNVPRRGNFLATIILGTPPPPPPPEVPPLEDPASGEQTLTLRERLELHRKKPECASCHAKMDPLGFGLENFDAIGRWRDKDAGKPINASGTLISGESFSNAKEMKAVLLDRRDDFARSMIESMMIYAYGRGLSPDDQCVVDDALRTLEKNEDRLSALLETIVASIPFTHRRNAEF